MLRLKVTVPCKASAVNVRMSAAARSGSVCFVAEIAVSRRLADSGSCSRRTEDLTVVDISRGSIIGGRRGLRIEIEFPGELFEFRTVLQDAFQQALESSRGAGLGEQVAQLVARLQQGLYGGHLGRDRKRRQNSDFYETH